jgi:O-antigen/teichoic acid export membrane protein
MSADLIRLLRLTVLGAGLFLLLPMAVAPIALFAWVGQIGYHAAGTFTLLALAMVSSLLVTPLSLAAQAMGRASMEFKRAGGAMLINVPLSASLIYAYGKEGAALGTLIACFIANTVFARWLLKSLRLSAPQLAAALWPLLSRFLVVTLALAAATAAIEPLVISSRWYMAPAAVGLYLMALTVAAFWLWRSAALNDGEREYLSSLLKRWWGAR